MSAWLRCLVRPPDGYVITELDYSSQEFAIGAILSKDANMIEAYVSGDPYLYFAKKAKAVPEGGTKAQYSAERDLFKSTVLGLQYGMGVRNLAIKLTIDTGREVTEKEAQKLIDLHKKVFRKYWRWLESIDRQYARKKYLRIPCGWALFGDNPVSLSVRNFPTQGAGSSIIREAVRVLFSKNINTLATLHDSVYIISKESEAEKEIKEAEEILKKSFNKILKQTDVEIRVDACSHRSDEVWVSEKGKSIYEILKKYLKKQENKNDIVESVDKEIYGF